MALEIDRKLKGLSLTDDEEEFVECEKEESMIMRDQLLLCLVGKLLSKNPYSVDALKNTMRSARRLEEGVVVREIENGLFMFQFFSLTDKLKVLENGPWSFDGSPLLLKEVENDTQPSEIVFDSIRFWVKAYDVPLDKRTKSMAFSMASKMGKFVEYDDSNPLGWNKFTRFRVDLKLDKPLRRWIRVSTKGGSKWIELKYEKLMDFCYACGTSGHSYQGCPHYDDSVPESELPYGLWLRASPTRKRRNFDQRVEEERNLCQMFRDNLEEGKVRTKLNFDVGNNVMGNRQVVIHSKGEERTVANTYAQIHKKHTFIGHPEVGNKGSTDEGDAKISKRGRTDEQKVVASTFDTPMFDRPNDTHEEISTNEAGLSFTIPASDISAEIGEGQSPKFQLPRAWQPSSS